MFEDNPGAKKTENCKNRNTTASVLIVYAKK